MLGEEGQGGRGVGTVVAAHVGPAEDSALLSRVAQGRSAHSSPALSSHPSLIPPILAVAVSPGGSPVNPRLLCWPRASALKVHSGDVHLWAHDGEKQSVPFVSDECVFLLSSGS